MAFTFTEEDSLLGCIEQRLDLVEDLGMRVQGNISNRTIGNCASLMLKQKETYITAESRVVSTLIADSPWEGHAAPSKLAASFHTFLMIHVTGSGDGDIFRIKVFETD